MDRHEISATDLLSNIVLYSEQKAEIDKVIHALLEQVFTGSDQLGYACINFGNDGSWNFGKKKKHWYSLRAEIPFCEFYLPQSDTTIGYRASLDGVFASTAKPFFIVEVGKSLVPLLERLQMKLPPDQLRCFDTTRYFYEATKQLTYK